MAEVGSAYMSIMPSAKGFGRSLESQVDGEVGAAGKGIGGKFGTALKVGAVAAVGGAVLAGAFLKGALGEAREAQKITAQTEAVIKSTGAAAGVTAEQVGKLAGALSLKTGIDDEVIQSGQNMLLTFKNIRNEAGAGNDIFNQTTKTLVDMSAAMGTEPKQAAIQLGKALNDPIKGISALSRVGVTFTEGQKKVIEGLVKGGDVMGAQKIILKELNSEFGGSAEAQATAGDKLRVSWGNFQETVGTALLPLWDRLLNGMTQVTLYMTSQVGPAFAKVSAFVTPLVAQVQAAFGGGAGGGGLLVGIRSLGDYLTTTLVPVFTQYVGILRNQVLPMAQSVAAYYVGTFLPAMLATWAVVAQKLRPVFEQLVATYRTQVLPTASLVLAKFREWGPTIQKIASVVVSLYGKWIIFQATIAGKVLPVVIRFIGFLIANAIPAILRNIEITAKFVGAMIALGKAVVDRIQDFARFVKGVKDKLNEAIGFVKTVPGKITSALSGLYEIGLHAGGELVRGLVDSLEDGLGDVAAAVVPLAGIIKDHFPGSPVKTGPLTSWNNGGAGKRLIQMLTDGIIAGTPGAVTAAVGAATSIEKGVLDGLTSMRDKTKSILDGLKSDFGSLRDSIAGAFAPDVFSATDRFAFMGRLGDAASNLTAMRGALRKLRSWNVDPGFLSQLFASGNSALILDLASGTGAQARSSAQAFGAVGSLSQQLGSSVARNDIGPRIDRTNAKLERIEKALKSLPKDFGREINGAATAGNKGRVA